MINTEERINNLYKVHTTAGWAKVQLNIITDMAADRALPGSTLRPMSMNFLAGELLRIQDGILTLDQLEEK